MTRRRFPAIYVLLAALLGPAPIALAQGQIPPATITATDPTAEQLKQVDEYVAANLPVLSSDDSDKIKQARNRLLEPLRPKGNTGPSVRFRTEYSNRLAKTLGELAVSQREVVAFNAVRVAGELATPDAVAVLVKGIDDKRPSVRLMAAAGMGRTFDAVHQLSPAIGADAVVALIGRVGQMVAAEQQPQVLQTAVRSLVVAMSITRQGYQDVRPAAFAALTTQVGVRARQLGAGGQIFMPALLIAADATRTALASVSDPVLRLNDAGNKQAAELSGHLVACIMRRLADFQAAAGDTDAVTKAKADYRAVAADVVAMAEASAVVALSRPPMNTSIEAKNMAEEFKKGTAEGDRAFFQKALQLLTELERPAPGPALGPFMQQAGGR
jgi:hypothetical protein